MGKEKDYNDSTRPLKEMEQMNNILSAKRLKHGAKWKKL